MPQDEASWQEVDRLLTGLLVQDGPDLASDDDCDDIPPHDVSPLEGKLLHLIARLAGARRILELGTLAGYSTIWLARALPADGRLISLEIDAHFASAARRNIEAAGLQAKVEIKVGPALTTLDTFETDETFDLIFLDADKRLNPAYLEHALRLSRPGTVLIADNVVRNGSVAKPEDDSARGVRRFLELVAAEPRLTATAIQTVGAKGHDGFALALVVSPGAAPGT